MIRELRAKLCRWMCGDFREPSALPEEVRVASHAIANQATALQAGARQLAQKADVLASLAEAMQGGKRGRR